LELEFSAGDLDGCVDAVIDEFPEPFKVGDHLPQFGNLLLSSAQGFLFWRLKPLPHL
jgi:hypothetical protein